LPWLADCPAETLLVNSFPLPSFSASHPPQLLLIGSNKVKVIIMKNSNILPKAANALAVIGHRA
jgi:hypothetical protein